MLTVRIAQTKADLDACFRLRYEVFVAELGTIPAERFPGRRECDSFDTLATTTHLLACIGPEPVGTVRILEPNPDVGQANGWAYGFSLEQCFDLGALHAEAGKSVIELPRSSVLRSHRSKGHSVSNGLWGAAVHLLRMKGYRFIVAGTNPQTDDLEEAQRIFKILQQADLAFAKAQVHARRPDFYTAKASPSRLSVDSPTATSAAPLPSMAAPKLPPILSIFVGLGGLALGRPIFDPHVDSCNIPMIWPLDSPKLAPLFSHHVPFALS